MRDLMNHIDAKCLFAPIAAQTNDSTARVSETIDRRGFDSLTLVLVNGTNTDADATFAVLVEDDDDSAMGTAAAVPDEQLIGTEALAAFTFTHDKKCRKIGYRGTKRYVRVTVTPTNNNSGDWFMAGIAILGHPANAPTANPPV